MISAFEEEFDVTVTEDFYPSNEEMLARVQEGASFDVVVPSDYMVSIMIEEGLLTPIDADAVPNLDNLADRFASELPFDPEGEHTGGAPRHSASTWRWWARTFRTPGAGVRPGAEPAVRGADHDAR